MKLSKQFTRYLKPKHIYKILLTVLLALVLFIVVKYLIKSREGLDNNNQKTLLLCHMTGCGHCDKLMPDWDKLASNNTSNVIIKKVEVGEDDSYAKKYDVQGFPTILLLGANGKKIGTYEGERTYADLQKYVEKNQ